MHLIHCPTLSVKPGCCTGTCGEVLRHGPLRLTNKFYRITYRYRNNFWIRCNTACCRLKQEAITSALAQGV